MRQRVRGQRKRRQTQRRKLKKFDRKMQANTLLVFCIVIILFIAVIARIWYIQKEDKDRYEKRVLSQQTYVSNEIPYQRGSIVDRNDTVFARSVKIYNLVLDCTQVLDKEKYKEPTIEALTTAFNITREEIEDILEEKPEARYNVLLKGLEYKEKDVFVQLQQEDKNNNIKGVWFEEEYKREYPLKTLASNTIGFAASRGSQGVIGLESYYNEELNGTNGREYGYFNADLKLERTVKPAVAGNTLVTTLDANIQSIVEKHIKKFNDEIGSKNTAVMVMNPNNGEIYAMASTQSFDLNEPFDLTGVYKQKEIDKMTEEEKDKALNAIWRNFCISDAYEPGSTFKPITVAAGLEENKINENTSFHCTGGSKVAGRRIGCAALYGHNTITLEQSLMKSCNVAMMSIGKTLSKTKFYEYQKNFGFGSKTGIDLSGEAVGSIFALDKLGPVDLAVSSFGQGFTCTMLQIVCANASIINGGYYYEPHVVKSIRNENGATVKNIEPVLVRQTVSSKTSQLLRKFMYETVENGTATYAKVEGYEIGGKTGTAEKHPRGNNKYLISFIGFTPIEQPEVLVYVIIDEPNLKDQAHSEKAQVLSRDIMEEMLPFLELYPATGTKDSKQKKEKTEENKTKEDNKTEDTNKNQNGENTQETQKPEGTQNPEETKNPEETDDPDEVFSFFDVEDDSINDPNDSLNSNLSESSNNTNEDGIEDILPDEWDGLE